MDRIEKALTKLSLKERQWVKAMLQNIASRNFKELNVKKLKGHEDIFRARKGDIRIIYRMRDGNIFILAIERRSEKTYETGF